MIAAIAAFGCQPLNDFLDVKPTNKVSAEEVVSSPAGIQAFLANLYYRMPIEAFDFTAESKPCPDQKYADGFHFNDGAPNNSARYVWLLTDDCTGPEVDDIPNDNYYLWWYTAFSLLHDLNEFTALIPTMESIVDLVTKGEKMPPKLLKAFTDGKASNQSVSTSEKIKVLKTESINKEETKLKVSEANDSNQITSSEKASVKDDTDQQKANDYKLEFDFKVSNEPQEIEEEKTDFEIPSFEGIDLSSLDIEQEEIVKKKVNIPHYKAGLNAYKQKKYNKALEEFNLSISNKEDAPIMIDVYIGMILYSKNDYASAISHLNLYLEI